MSNDNPTSKPMNTAIVGANLSYRWMMFHMAGAITGKALYGPHNMPLLLDLIRWVGIIERGSPINKFLFMVP